MTRRSVSMEVQAGDGLHLTAPALAAGQRITVTLEHKAGRRARLRITADDVVKIERFERPDPPGMAKATVGLAFVDK